MGLTAMGIVNLKTGNDVASDFMARMEQNEAETAMKEEARLSPFDFLSFKLLLTTDSERKTSRY